jgi:threonine dehydratase
LVDKPGQLATVSQIIAECGGNVTSVLHERSNEGSAVNGCYLSIQIETKDFDQIALIESKLKSQGIHVIERS